MAGVFIGYDGQMPQWGEPADPNKESPPPTSVEMRFAMDGAM
jgi:hypothetical protein